MEVKKIRREGNQLKITIPRKSNFKLGDYVAIIPIQINNGEIALSTKREQPAIAHNETV